MTTTGAALAAYVAAMEQQHGHSPQVRDGALVDQRDEDRFAGWRLRGDASRTCGTCRAFITPDPMTGTACECTPQGRQLAALLEVLRSTRGVLAMALKSAAPDFFTSDEDVSDHIQIKKIDAALRASGEF